jgi:putative acyl-CoA dehydrogenase
MTDGAACIAWQEAKRGREASGWRWLARKLTYGGWTSGQWMTEQAGGSDVSRSETTATPLAAAAERAARHAAAPDSTLAHVPGRLFALTGIKWFTSAITSEVAFVLARSTASARLALFVVAVQAEVDAGRVTLRRLKQKLGTRSLPTAELSLDGALGILVGADDGRGIQRIAPLFNITRVHNALSSTALFRRAYFVATAYAVRRVVRATDGSYVRLADAPVHRTTLGRLRVDSERCIAASLTVARLQGSAEAGSVEDAQLLRQVTPLVKAYTGRLAVAGVSECIEACGGFGYCEDSELPVILRDVQVTAIWEGTTNVLALDFLRALRKAGGRCDVLDDARRRGAPTDACDQLASRLANVREEEARDVAMAVAELWSDSLLIPLKKRSKF